MRLVRLGTRKITATCLLIGKLTIITLHSTAHFRNSFINPVLHFQTHFQSFHLLSLPGNFLSKLVFHANFVFTILSLIFFLFPIGKKTTTSKRKAGEVYISLSYFEKASITSSPSTFLNPQTPNQILSLLLMLKIWSAQEFPSFHYFLCDP